MGNKFSVRPEVQDFMHEHSVSRLAKGSQSTVYGGLDVVVKRFGPPSPLELRSEEAGIPGAYGTHKAAKELLGGLVLPFEMAEGIKVHSIDSSTPMTGIQVNQYTFDRAVVQERCDSKHSLEQQLKVACEQGNTDRVVELLRLFIDFRLQLLQRGAYLHDPIPDNMVVPPDNNMLLRDIGAVKFATRDQMMRIRSMWWQKLAGPFAFLGFRRAVKRGARKGMKEEWGEFKDDFMDFYHPEALGKMYPSRDVRRALASSGKKGRRNEGERGLRVPNVKLPRSEE